MQSDNASYDTLIIGTSPLAITEAIYQKSLKRAVLNIDNAVRFFLAEEGYDPIYGARPLRRAIMHLLEDNLGNLDLYVAFRGYYD